MYIKKNMLINNKMNKFINIILFALVIVLVLVFIIRSNIRVGFTTDIDDLYGNIIYTWNKESDKALDSTDSNMIINLPFNHNIDGILINSDVDLHFKLKIVDNTSSMNNEFISVNKNTRLETNKYYDLKKLAINTSQIHIVPFINNDGTSSDISGINKINIYGTKTEDLMLDDIVVLVKENNTLSIEFKKHDNIENIKNYYVIIVKYDYKKNYISKKIINIDNNLINFKLEAKNILPDKYHNLVSSQDNTTEEPEINPAVSLKTIELLINEKDKSILLDTFKLVIKYLFVSNQNTVFTSLQKINEYASMKFMNPETTNITNEDFKKNYENNNYFYQNEIVKALLQYLYELTNTSNTSKICEAESCYFSTEKLAETDDFNLPFYYKIGIGFNRLDVNGDMITSPITTYTTKTGDKLFTLNKDQQDLNNSFEYNTDTLYNKMMINADASNKKIRKFIGENYPNNFNVLESTLKDFIDIDKYENKKYSPIQVNVEVTNDEEKEEE